MDPHHAERRQPLRQQIRVFPAGNNFLFHYYYLTIKLLFNLFFNNIFISPQKHPRDVPAPGLRSPAAPR